MGMVRKFPQLAKRATVASDQVGWTATATWDTWVLQLHSAQLGNTRKYTQSRASPIQTFPVLGQLYWAIRENISLVEVVRFLRVSVFWNIARDLIYNTVEYKCGGLQRLFGIPGYYRDDTVQYINNTGTVHVGWTITHVSAQTLPKDHLQHSQIWIGPFWARQKISWSPLNINFKSCDFKTISHGTSLTFHRSTETAVTTVQ